MVGVKRIVKGEGVRYPLGNPNLSRTEERSLRKQILINALQALQVCPEGTKDLLVEK